MSEDRLWKFRRPEWLNSIWARNAGVYAAGAFVRDFIPSITNSLGFFFLLCFAIPRPYDLAPKPIRRLANAPCSIPPVLARLLHPPRLRRVVQIRTKRFRPTRDLRRLAALHLLEPGHAHHQ